MSETFSFGEWVSGRRKALDLTQRELAERAACGLATIKKIEGDERKPSRELAGLLADALRVSPDSRDTFMECARGLRPVDALGTPQTVGEDSAHSSVSAAPATSLPAQSTPFIGRDAELAQIKQHLNDPACRLLTLVGAGGIGKTRLAIAAGGNLRTTFSNGVYFVPLAAIADGGLIPTAIAHSLHLTLNGPPEIQLVTYLRNKMLLLVLDNCEQLGEGVAWLSELLAAAPGIKLLATSREPLQLAEEWVYKVGELDEEQAVELFQQSARRRSHDFELTEQQPDVWTICGLVENLPLAIELAANWTSFMSCAQIAEHIQHDIDFLAANVRNIPERHRSMRAVFDHSWKLLSPTEQAVLMRLSVFRGGWGAEEAEAVAGAALPTLRALVDKSLVRPVAHDRYDMHELTRQYAADQLRAAGLEHDAQERHSRVYRARVEAIMVRTQDVESFRDAFQKAIQEGSNFRAALGWAVEAGEAELAVSILNNLWLFWFQADNLQDGLKWADQIVTTFPDLPPHLKPRTMALLGVLLHRTGAFQRAAGVIREALPLAEEIGDKQALLSLWQEMSFHTADYEEATAYLEKSLSLSREMGFKFNVSIQLQLLGDRARLHGDYVRADAFYSESIARQRELGAGNRIAYPIGNRGRIAFDQGDYAPARAAFEESVRLSRESGNIVGIADWSLQLGAVALAQGDYQQAQASLRETLTLCQQSGNVSEITDALVLSAGLALALEEPERAARLLGASDAALEQYHNILEPTTRTRHEQYMAQTRAYLDAAAFEALYSAGRDLSLDAAVDCALEAE